MNLFTFSIKENNYAIPIHLIFEIIKAPEIIFSKKFPDFKGFINHRNIIYPIACLAKIDKINIIVLLKVENEIIGIAIEEMGDISHGVDIQSVNFFGKNHQLVTIDKKSFYIVDPKIDLPQNKYNFNFVTGI